MQIVPVPLDHPDAVRLDHQVQLEYVQRYGDGDVTPLRVAEFLPPHGLYLVVYDESGRPVASGGWRSRDGGGVAPAGGPGDRGGPGGPGVPGGSGGEADEGLQDGDAELKRMYVVPEARGRGLARRLLAELEASARAAGRRRVVLETGTKQPEALALYASSGYVPTRKFGLYRHEEDSRCFAKPLTGAAAPATGTPAPTGSAGPTGPPGSVDPPTPNAPQHPATRRHPATRHVRPPAGSGRSGGLPADPRPVPGAPGVSPWPRTSC